MSQFKLFRGLAALATALLTYCVAAAPLPPSSPIAIDLHVGQVHVIRAAELKRIAIGNGKVIQATALDGGQVLVIPEAAGQSSLHLWDKNGVETSFDVRVVPADVNRLLEEVKALVGRDERISARIVGDKIILEGSELSDEQAARISEVARRYPQIVNLISRVGLERMIEMDVRMLEVRRDALEQIGIKWSGSAQGPSFGIIGDLHRSDAFRPGGAAADAALAVARRAAPFATTLGLATSIGSIINLLVQNGDAVVLAEPRLSCRSGGTARFIAGGELPVPFASGLGAVSVGFKEYGIKFDVSPMAGESGVIAAKIATEISSINFDVQVQSVPGLTKRRAETEVNLRENETLVIAGLLSEESSRSIDKVPAIGDVPILGRLFRSRQFRDRKTDLVVFVTPRFVGAASERNQQAIDDGRRRLDAARERVRMVD
ncbi:MAG: type II and III secretion system protein family protein [Burkholderiaceae bacterium]